MDTKREGYDEFGMPIPIKGEPMYKYYIRLDRYIHEFQFVKREKILEFINIWFTYRYNEKVYFQKIWHFKDFPYEKMPQNQHTKQFLIENFEEYNEFFELDLEYDEELFTTYNALYMIKLMLKKLKGTLKKQVVEKEIDGVKKKFKYYTINVR